MAILILNSDFELQNEKDTAFGLVQGTTHRSRSVSHRVTVIDLHWYYLENQIPIWHAARLA